METWEVASMAAQCAAAWVAASMVEEECIDKPKIVTSDEL